MPLGGEEEGESGHHPPGGVTSALVLSPAALRSRELPAPAPLSPARRLVTCLTLSLPSACCAAPSVCPSVCVYPPPPQSRPLCLCSHPHATLLLAPAPAPPCPLLPAGDRPCALPGKPFNCPIACPWGRPDPAGCARAWARGRKHARRREPTWVSPPPSVRFPPGARRPLQHRGHLHLLRCPQLLARLLRRHLQCLHLPCPCCLEQG